MAKSDSDEWVKTEEKPSDFDEGLGDDWESAFQAEEFMFSPGEQEEEGFFQETAGPSATYEFTPPDESELAGLPDLDQGNDKTVFEKPAAAADRPQPGVSSTGPWQKIRESFSALPLVHRLALGATTLLVLLLALALLWPVGRQPKTVLVSPAARPSIPRPARYAAPTFPKKVQRTWQLAPFVLPVAADPHKGPAILDVDLSLVLVLAPGKKLPRDKTLLVRDLIYRYYRHQPLATLRRFDLAREEMKRALLAWLRTHWSQGPAVETVVFDRYQLS